VRSTYDPPRRRPRRPYDDPRQPPACPAKAPPPPLAPGRPPTGHSQLAAGTPYQFQTPDGRLLGNVLPLAADPGGSPVDGRTCALQALGRFLTEIPYRRRGAKGDPPAAPGQPPAIDERLPAANFYVDEPDGEQDLLFPSIVCLGGEATRKTRGFTPEPDEATRDVYGQGTVVLPMSDHAEELRMKIYGSELGDLRGLAGMVEQMLVPSDGSGGVLLRMPDYFGEVARFTSAGTEWPENPDAVRNRRYAVHRLTLDFVVVRLVRYAPFLPSVSVDVEVPAYADPRVVPGGT